GVDRFRDLRLIVKDQVHELPVVLLHRALPGGEVVGFRPAETELDPDPPDPSTFIGCTGIPGAVETGDTEARAHAGGAADAVEHRRGFLLGVWSVLAGFETDGGHG